MAEAWLPANGDSSMNSQKTDLCTQLSEKYQNYPFILLSWMGNSYGTQKRHKEHKTDQSKHKN